MMMDVSKNQSTLYFQKKITAYIDGSLTADEKSEFEAFMRTHPEIENQIKQKEHEMMLIKSLIPAAELEGEALESLENEIKQSVFDLLKEEPKSVLGKIKNSWEDWVNR